MKTLLLACSYITPHALAEIERARCPIHKDLPGLPTGLEVVELRYEDETDLHLMSVWDVPREIEITSRCLHLNYAHEEAAGGYALSHLHQDEDVAEIIRKEREPKSEVNPDDLGDLDDHPF